MASELWRGSWAARIRIVSGLILMLYVTLHLLNIAAVLISPGFANAFQDVRLAVTRSDPGEVVVGVALVAHLVLAIYKIILRRSLRMSLTDAIQIVFGVTIPLILASHVIYTHVAADVLGVETRLGYLTTLIWDTFDGWMQVVLMAITWIHGAIGLHMWLRMTTWWQRSMPWLLAVAVLIPTLATLGFVSAGRLLTEVLEDPETRAMAFEAWNFPDRDGFDVLAVMDDRADQVMWVALGLLLVAVALRQLVAAIRKPVRITYVDGPSVRAARGQTILETSRASGIAHTALCGGRGRCTTCRVIVEDGLDDLPPASTAEARTLAAVGAPPNARLACQVRPNGPTTVFRVFREDGKRSRAHASQGKEARLAILFLDMRGFTARTHGQLPYDVVFLLNRFFDEIVPPIIAAGGTVDKYLGDGLMAVFETDTPRASASAALKAVEGIAKALAHFNKTLTDEGSDTVAIGIGVHLGNVVLGEIGARGLAPRTLIGDTVNTASRLEGQTKTLGVQVILSRDVLEAAGHAADLPDMVSLDLRGRDTALAALPIKDATNMRDHLITATEPVPAT
mmetsp:Transcript_29252/g.56677  ORF Transcript_29252/g.56677 Transcript_29252/m.56677 type:complete len:566 (-) Transcript_29252:34-1731(-)